MVAEFLHLCGYTMMKELVQNRGRPGPEREPVLRFFFKGLTLNDAIVSCGAV